MYGSSLAEKEAEELSVPLTRDGEVRGRKSLPEAPRRVEAFAMELLIPCILQRDERLGNWRRDGRSSGD